MTLDDDSLHSLLSRGRMSGAQRERAFEGALRRSQRGSRRWGAIAAGVLIPLAAGLALFIGTSEGPGTVPAANSNPVAKGRDEAVLRATCLGRPAGECETGDRLVFEVEGAKTAGYFAAYAECASGERIWYFPTAQGDLPKISGEEPRTVIDQAARIGPEHGVGSCSLHLFELDRPATRAELVAGGLAGAVRADVSLEVKRGGGKDEPH